MRLDRADMNTLSSAFTSFFVTLIFSLRSYVLGPEDVKLVAVKVERRMSVRGGLPRAAKSRLGDGGEVEGVLASVAGVSLGSFKSSGSHTGGAELAKTTGRGRAAPRKESSRDREMDMVGVGERLSEGDGIGADREDEDDTGVEQDGLGRRLTPGELGRFTAARRGDSAPLQIK
jgi:hypothetical protein